MSRLVLPSSDVALLSKDILRRNSQLRLLATGDSMLPAIRNGDIITVAPINSAIRRSDILLFEKNSSCIIAHRVVRINTKQQYLMCGDANEHCDGWISHSQILGIVTGYEREGRITSFNTFRFRLHSIHLVLIKNLRLILASNHGTFKKGAEDEKNFFGNTNFHHLFGRLQSYNSGQRAKRTE